MIDQDNFFKAQVMFWLLAAIDGHTKNLSVFIEPQTAYRMTPLYDVISAYPLMAKGSLPEARARMAMSLKRGPALPLVAYLSASLLQHGSARGILSRANTGNHAAHTRTG
ncbi:HipA domain-containing protein [Salinicola sp. MIT1003]|uniref:HipA domain-containing protein n=1 Tax=Salinicola sp. MIT1003 TaxID=1882734 RepID=UPI0008DE4B9B|nr:HipA domain-containing protein [Salinicola sp. MIT1003]OHZ01197.1 hypothetical protein BC443_12310 [Salinicola sp. MIT1003]